MSHAEEHHHHHAHAHEHGAVTDSLAGMYRLAIALNLAFVLIEAGIGWWKRSLGLLSDAGHNLSDVGSLVLALIAFRLSMTRRTGRYTYGYKKSSVLISLLNAIILVGVVAVILMESVEKLMLGTAADAGLGSAIIVTAATGIVVNGLSAWLLHRNQEHDINTRGAFLHMLADTLVSLGVVISGVIIHFFPQCGWLDPVAGLVIGVVILISTWHLLSESIRMSIDAVPEHIDPEAVLAAMNAEEGVSDVHHLHIWPISTTEIALTAHVVLRRLDELEQVKHTLKEKLHDMGIQHATLEMEAPGTDCDEHTGCPQS